MKERRILLFCFLLCAITFFTCYWLTQRQFKKIGVVDAIKLFDGYNMKKELEEKAKKKLQQLNQQVDSAENRLRMARATQNEEEIKKATYTYSYIKNTLEAEYKQSNHDINEQVWKRLNAVLEEYGKKKGLHLIIGANGMGSVLFEDGYYDLTNDLIKYSNSKYEEGN